MKTWILVNPDGMEDAEELFERIEDLLKYVEHTWKKRSILVINTKDAGTVGRLFWNNGISCDVLPRQKAA